MVILVVTCLSLFWQLNELLIVFLDGGIGVDKNVILERLVSIRNNAKERACQESKVHPERQNEIKAFILENGIEMLIMEIQNTILAEYRMPQNNTDYKRHISSQAS